MPRSQKKQVGYATKEVINRAKFQWFDVPEEEKPAEEGGGKAADSDSSPTVQSKAQDPAILRVIGALGLNTGNRIDQACHSIGFAI